MKKVCILGLGYIGLPTALMFSSHGLDVVGVDTNAEVIHSLSNGTLHIEEPGLKECFDQALEGGRLRFSKQVEDADVFIITVPTPFLNDELGQINGSTYKKADMRFVLSATEMILPHLRHGNLVVLESTSPPRTTVGLLQPILERSGLKAGVDFSLVYCPERVLPGQILRELVENARIVGGINPSSAEAGRQLYATFVKGDILLTDATTAEMCKLMENTYRDVNIAIGNEFSRLADRFGIDIWEAIRLANRHPRVRILNPGPGVGGHCISVDPWFLVEAAPEITSLIRTARQVNDDQPSFVLELVRRVLNGRLDGAHIAALGLSYKQDVDDLRESPAIEVCHLLQAAGASIKAFEPYKPTTKINGFTSVEHLEDALAGADLVLLLVGHASLRSLDPAAVSRLTPARLVVDTVNGWEPSAWQAAGFDYHRLGTNK